MSYNEYLRDKKRSLPQIVSPTRINTSGLFTQMQRYKAAVPQNTTESAGSLIEHKSAGNVLATLGNAATCCAPAQATVTVDGCCTVVYTPYPTNGYRPPRPDCQPVNNPLPDPSICDCP